MKHMSSVIRVTCCAIFLLSALPVSSAELLDDHAITVHSASEIAEKRKALIHYLWGSNGFPKRLPDKTVTNIACPVKQLDHLERVDELRIEMAPGLEGLAYHFM